jgi:hypothetical protein
MKLLYTLVTVFAICLSCKNQTNKNQEAISNIEDKELSKNNGSQSQREDILGSYVGYFGERYDANKIRLLITKIEKNNIEGRTIVGGNDRPFSGSIDEDAAFYIINAKEPGDNKYDGEFNFKIKINDPNELSGNWVPFKPSTTRKNYTLERKQFKYDPNAGDYSFASTRLLNTEDVENMPKTELSYMRNAIFARHGYCFKKKEMREMFEINEWYVPNTVDIKNYLTEIEKKNIELIKRYEKYAEDYGDQFGR